MLFRKRAAYGGEGNEMLCAARMTELIASYVRPTCRFERLRVFLSFADPKIHQFAEVQRGSCGRP